MSKSRLKNASPEEIRQYFKGGSVQWVRTFQDNYVPDDIIFEFKERIFSGDYTSRVQEIVNMHVRENIKMSDELFNLLISLDSLSKLPCYNIVEVYNVIDYIKTLSEEEISNLGYTTIQAVKVCPVVDLELLEIALLAKYQTSSKIDILSDMIKENKLTPEAKERLVQYAKEKWPLEQIKAVNYTYLHNTKTLFTAFEFIQMAPKEKLIRFFNDHSGKNYNEDDFKDPEILDYIVETIIEVHNDGDSYSHLRLPDWQNLRDLIKDHERFSEIEDILVSDQERYMSKDLDWKDVDVRISNNELSHEVVESILLRQDSPLWFTDKYQSKLLQIIARNSTRKDKQQLLVDRHGNYMTHPFYTFINNHSEDGFF